MSPPIRRSLEDVGLAGMVAVGGDDNVGLKP